MEASDNPQFDEWCIIELFGHQKMAGHVTQAPFGDFLRVDVHVVDPESNEGTVLYTRLLNPKAIYAINPVSKEVAIAVGRQMAQPPVSRWDMQRLLLSRDEVSVARPRYDPEMDDDNWYDDDDDKPF